MLSSAHALDNITGKKMVPFGGRGGGTMVFPTAVGGTH